MLALTSEEGGSPIRRLKERFLRASDEAELVCPLAAETIVETTGLKAAQDRLRIHELHTYLAGGRLGGPLVAFKSMWQMIKEETLALARSEPFPSAFELARWKNVDDDELAAETQQRILEAKARMNARVQAHQLNHIEGEPTLDITSAGVILEHVAHVYRQVERLLDDKPLDPKDHMGYELAEYLRQQAVSKEQLAKLIQDILYHRWEAIPTIFNRTQLAGQLEVDYRNASNPRGYKVNDEVDIPRLAVGLSSADIIITDAAMAQACATVKTNRWTDCKVFAVRDTEKILGHLELALAH